MVKNIGFLSCFILLSLMLVACQNKVNHVFNDSTASLQINKSINTKHYSTSDGRDLFYTYPFEFSDLDETEVLSSIIVKLSYEKGCIYLDYGPYKASPLLPYGVSSWDENNKTLKYFNATYRVGDTIETGGYLFPESEGNGYTTDGFKTTPSSVCKLNNIIVLHGLPVLK